MKNKFKLLIISLFFGLFLLSSNISSNNYKEFFTQRISRSEIKDNDLRVDHVSVNYIKNEFENILSVHCKENTSRGFRGRDDFEDIYDDNFVKPTKKEIRDVIYTVIFGIVVACILIILLRKSKFKNM